MSRFFETYLKSGYLLEPEISKELILALLIAAVILSLGPIILALIFRILKRKAVYQKFDRVWFWGYFTLGLFGVFIWFSQYESLPFFAMRIVSYLWLFSVAGFTAFLVYLFRSKAPKELSRYYEKKRKEKYLR